MELRQLRYFVRVAELGSIGRAARDLDVVASALSQQISRLESELSTRLRLRTPTGVVPTPAGQAFLRQAQLTLRHAESAVAAAREARLSGMVSVGFAPTTASLLARPFFAAMAERYPSVRLHLVEGLSGNLNELLASRRLELAVLFQNDGGKSRNAIPVLDERLFLLARRGLLPLPDGQPVATAQLAGLPLAVTSKAHGLRAWVQAAFERAGLEPWIAVEIDGLTTLMDIVQANAMATIQPGAAVARVESGLLDMHPIDDPFLFRRNLVSCLNEDELSPAAIATRIVLIDVMRGLVRHGGWPGATLLDP
ncbi:LysR family transcriptional regulator [Bordetella hinzii]|uniref:LysR family transcriptional regulator n=1 Tax=Bordetella hinzii TaxID=103855 RepID=A0AAN1RYV6_9BORD|nr:LysR family transcriptional regulator [Bordetella hinzii]AKQ60384.1 HTH-type transcriptional regulator CynR [Bordetella hinzii]AZW18559.1 LysR family transcriptional regulator [Bordetella hinzii]MBZ0077013.1 LysR family transcriptional regulator [Bordetella hinzii]MBZ0081632.1 LysR family transcriptional regulator [Bordetella hinzii]MBZ0085938.1 LysR family transcriptional regulator [Bordetella hinzii]